MSELAHIFLFQRNEEDILVEWIEHHAKIAGGYSGITVVDHKSTDSSISILNRYADLGVHVRWYTGEYRNKGKILTEEMIKYKKTVKLLIPLDADEFIITHDGNNVIKDIYKIIDNLRIISDMQYSRIFFGKIYNYVNTMLYPKLSDMNTFFIYNFIKDANNIHKKCFFLSNTFLSTDMGNHYGGISFDVPKHKKSIVDRNIGLLHFQMRGFNHFNNKNDKNLSALWFNKQGHTTCYGKHWHNDYLISKTKGAHKAFADKYLDDKNVIDYTFSFFEKADQINTQHLIPDQDNINIESDIIPLHNNNEDIKSVMCSEIDITNENLIDVINTEDLIDVINNEDLIDVINNEDDININISNEDINKKETMPDGIMPIDIVNVPGLTTMPLTINEFIDDLSSINFNYNIPIPPITDSIPDIKYQDCMNLNIEKFIQNKINIYLSNITDINTDKTAVLHTPNINDILSHNLRDIDIFNI